MNRAFYGIMNSKLLMTSEGIYTNAIYGFLAILLKLIGDENPDYICVAFDRKAPTFRHQKYEGYKATRKGMPEELKMQMPLMKEILEAMNIKIWELDGYEADDILGTLARYGEKEKMEVLLLTGDRDYLQLVSKHVTVRIPTTKQGSTETTDYTPESVKEKFGIEPKQFIQIKGLMGDTSDNIPGVPGVGEKTAFALIRKYKTVDKIYELLESSDTVEDIRGKLREKFEANKELAYLSRDLGTIDCKVPLTFTKEELAFHDYNNDALYRLFVKLQFKNYIDKLGLKKPESEELDLLNGEEEAFRDGEIVLKPLEEFWKEIEKEDIPIIVSYVHDEYFTIYYQNIAYSKKSPNVAELKQFFEDESIVKVGYDEKKEYLKLKAKGINPQKMDFDLMIASYLLNPSKDHYLFSDIVMEELGIMIEEEKEEEQLDFLSLAASSNCDLAEKEARHARYILACKQKLEKKLKEKEEWELFEKIEMPLMEVLAEMEFQGVLVDKQMLQDYSQLLSEKVEELSDDIMDMAGEEFNINSPKQLGRILFEKLNLPVIKETKNGYVTDAETLEKLKEEHPIIEKILEYRTVSKLKTTYADGLLPLIDLTTKRIHAKFNQTVTATGRISCTEPNLQNIPIRTELGREFRKIFVAPEGYQLIDADYSQIELRVLAHISGDEHMIKAFNEGKDIHAITASKVFDVPLEEVTKQMRTEAKAVNFGIVYGISDFGLGENIGISRRKAKVYIEKYFEKYPGIKAFMRKTVADCKEKGYVETLWHRKRYVPEIKSANFNVRQFGERVAMNAPIQGTAADIIKIAMIAIYRSLKANKMQAKLILQVHDELVIEAPDNEVEKAKQILEEEMENVIKLRVPLMVETQLGKNWYEAH